MELKEILEDELFQNLLFHTADSWCSHEFTNNNKYLNNILTDEDLESINTEIIMCEAEDPNPYDYFALVALYFLKGDRDKSIDYIEKFLELYDKPIKNNLNEILTEYAFKAADETNYYDKSENSFIKAYYLLRRKKLKDAIPLFEKLLGNQSEKINKACFNGLISCYFELNKFDLAMKYFNEFLSLYPDCLSIHSALGDYYIRIKEYNKAIESFNIEKDYFYNHPNPFRDNIRTTYNYTNLIECYLKIGKIDKLIQHFEKLLSSNAENEVLWTYLAICYQKKEEYDKAFEMVDKALSINPYYSEALSVLGENFYYKESYSRAIYYFKENIKVKYDDFYTYYYLGLVYIKLKDYYQGIEIFKFILSIWSNNGDAYFALASIYEHLGKIDLASEYFEKASKFKPFYIDEYEKIDFE